MLMNIKILDVTLRDGGYRNNFNFSPEFAHKVVHDLSSAEIPYIEIGYCNGSFIRKKEHGLTSSVDRAYIESLRAAVKGKSKLCVMVHPRNVNESDFEMLAEQGVGMIRVCLRQDQLSEGIDTVRLAKKYHFETAANVTRITEIPLSSVTDASQRAEDAGADVIYFADSNGSMIPSDVQRLVSKLSTRLKVPIGFHAHNNLSLALSNTIAAVDAGAQYIDTSICGMGKGAGNLHLSMIIAYLDRLDMDHQYDLVKILDLSDYAANNIDYNSLPTPLIDIMLGAYNLPIDVKNKIEAEVKNYTDISCFQVIHSLHKENCAQNPALYSLGQEISQVRSAPNQGAW
jgi:4-hydroxy 2-oxovalerate aldolase